TVVAVPAQGRARRGVAGAAAGVVDGGVDARIHRASRQDGLTRGPRERRRNAGGDAERAVADVVVIEAGDAVAGGNDVKAGADEVRQRAAIGAVEGLNLVQEAARSSGSEGV